MPYNPKNPLSTDYTAKDLPDGFTDAHVQQLKDAGFTQRDLLQYGLMSSGTRLAPTGPTGGFTGGGGTPPSSSLIATGGQAEPTNYFTPMFRLILGSGGQGTPGPGPGPTGPTGSTMNPLQLPSQQVIRQPQQVPQQTQQQPVQQVVTQAPQQQAVLNPIPVQPVQQYKKGGLVSSGQSSDQSADPYSNLSENQIRGVLGQVFQGVPLSESAIQQYIKTPSALGSLTLGGQPMQGPGNQIPGASQPGYNAGWSGGQSVNDSLRMLNALGLLGQQQPQGTPGPGPGPTGPTGSTMNPLQLPSQQVIRQAPQVSQQVPQQVQQQVPAQQIVTQAPQQQAVLNPIPVQVQPVQQYQQGGFVTSGDPNTGMGSYKAPKGPPTMYAEDNQLYQTDPKTGLLRSNTPQVYANATDLASMLGAAALNSPMVINQAPSSAISSKSGVAQVGGALMSSGVPTVPQGPWLTNPSVFAKATPYTPTAAPTVTPQAPATSVAYAPGQAFATPPAAPGYTLGSAMPQTSVPAVQTPWLAQGGMGGGGLPSAWGMPPAARPAPELNQAMTSGQPAPYTGTVHNDPYMSHAVSSLLGMPSNPWHPGTMTSSPGAVALATGPAPKKAATGGLVPGRGNEDTVPALLTPGEYVVPKQQVPQLVASGALKMQSGGLVPPNQDNEAPEVKRQPLQVPAPASSQSTSPSTSSAPSAPSQHPGAAQGILGGLQNLYQGGGGGLFGAGGGIPAGSTAGAGAYGTVGSLMVGQGSAGAAGSLGKAPAGGMNPKLQSALGGIGSGLTQAAQSIASSVQPWQMMPSAIPDPSQLPKYQVPTLQPERVS